MTIKVCHVTSLHPRYDARIFYKECVSLAKAGYDVTLLVAERNSLPLEIKSGVKIISVALSPKNRIDRLLRSSQIMRKAAIKIDADIYHFHDPDLLPVARYMKKLGKKAIFDSHENYPVQIEIKNIYHRFLENLSP